LSVCRWAEEILAVLAVRASLEFREYETDEFIVGGDSVVALY